MRFDQPPVVRISVAAARRPAGDTWPMTVPAVSQLMAGRAVLLEAPGRFLRHVLDD